MTRLKSKLLSFNAHRAVPVKIYSPANCEELRVPFKTDKIAKVVGKLASVPPPLPHPKKEGAEDEQAEEGEDQPNLITGVLIQNDFKISLMAPEDLKEYAGLTTTTIVCRQHLTLSAAGVDLIRWALVGTFGAIKEKKITDTAVDGKEVNGNGLYKEEADEEISRSSMQFTVMDCVKVLVQPGGRVEVEWEGNVINDGIADAVLAVLFTVESSPAAVRRKYPRILHHLIHSPNACHRIITTALTHAATKIRRRYQIRPPLQATASPPHTRPIHAPRTSLPLPRSAIRRGRRQPHPIPAQLLLFVASLRSRYLSLPTH